MGNFLAQQQERQSAQSAITNHPMQLQHIATEVRLTESSDLATATEAK